VYIAGRSDEKATKAINDIKEQFLTSIGHLDFLKVDFSDFKTIKPAVTEFLQKESSLHVLTNNAGVMVPPKGSVDAQGNELQMGTNCLGPFLFSVLLLPILQKTAKEAPQDSVRVTWSSSITAQTIAPTNGVQFDADGNVKQVLCMSHLTYGQSKAGNNFLAAEFARRYGKDGIISVSWNPGNLNSGLLRHMISLEVLAMRLLMYPPLFGAYTELYAGWSTDITEEHNGCYIAPWGRISRARADIDKGLKTVEEGGTGYATKFFDWCDKMTKDYQ
jgi:retinol dehydrogenase 12